MSLALLPGVRGLTSHDILDQGDRLKVSGIEAGSVATQVVQDQPLRNGANEVLIGEPVSLHSAP